MKRKVMKGISVLLSMAMVVVACTQDITETGIAKGIFFNKAYKITVSNQGKREHYIVRAKNEKAYDGIKQNLENDKLAVTTYMQDALISEENMLVMNLTTDEAGQLDDMSGVMSVEKDVELTANEVVPVDEKQVEKVLEGEQDLKVDQWNLRAIDCPENMPENEKQSKIKVAVVDSGVNVHEGIEVEQRVDLADEHHISVNFEDPNGHGTGIAGMINGQKEKGQLSGVADNVALYSVKVLDQDNTTPVSRLIEGIYWCIENEMDVINLSLGCSYDSEALAAAVQDAAKAGIILVAAAGNVGDDASLEYPAAYDDVIAVGASNEYNQVSLFTSGKEQIDVMAPGEKIWTYSMLGGYVAVDGTSIATAQVTGAVARILQVRKEADTEYVRKLLQISSVRSEQSQYAGVLNVRNAVQMAQENTTLDVNLAPKVREKNTAYDVDQIVTGCWLKSDHVNMITKNENLLNSKLVKAMSNSAFAADNVYSDYKMIHAQHNYVRNLHYLYMAARKVRASTASLNTRSRLSNFLKDNVDTVNLKDGSIGTEDIRQIRDNVILDYICGNQTRLDNFNEYKAAYIIGFALHLLGDTYAHRTMVPREDTELNSGLFGSNEKLRINFNIKKINFVIETRDLKFFELNSYEDDGDFYKERHDASEKSVKNILSLYQANNAFSPHTIFIAGVGYNLKLNNLRAYGESNGYTNEGLESISTDVYRVNGNHKDSSLRVFNNETDYIYYDYFIC